ncbi:universal stress protein [Planosporangium thailandense]|uniref:Universal stress protein n=1 Tax=Planosporangium thailandense TaxID=765197 RepID=A0ABX0Y5G1_9ACTN|nr:universal stress protein [Planosporangium thailandense]NJC73573.1 universal stress protein [Planosporangium thailandense]
MSTVPANYEEYGPARSSIPYECGTDGPRVIMVGVDSSHTALRAAAYAGGLARRQHAHLVTAFVAAPSAWIAIAAPTLTVAQEETYDELATELRDRIRAGAEEYGVSVTFVYRRGNPYVQLGRVADEVRADMVVVGASARPWHALWGSTATRLVRSGRWPVVVVP